MIEQNTFIRDLIISMTLIGIGILSLPIGYLIFI